MTSISMKRAHLSGAALIALGFGALARPVYAGGYAGVFQASAGVEIPSYSDFALASLPQYSGPGGITSVTLTFNGTATGGDELDYFFDENDGLNAAPFLQTIGVSVTLESSDPDVLHATGSAYLPGVTIPPVYCSEQFNECTIRETYLPGFNISISGSATWTDLSDFAGSFFNYFNLGTYPENDGGDPIFSLGGTLSETVTFTVVPEPSTWAMMLVGFAGLGWLARRRKLEAA